MFDVQPVKALYSAPDLIARVTAAFADIGKTTADITLADLAKFDEFHVRGFSATKELIAALDVTAEAKVLDAGAGVGGPARQLAAATGAHVTALDLSEDYVAAGQTFTNWAGLSDKIDHLLGNVADLTALGTGAFDAAWTIHVGMNVPDKAAFYAGIYRALKPGAKFIVYDIFETGQPFDFPLPWAQTADSSFTITLEEAQAALTGAGFNVTRVENHAKQALEFFAAIAAQAPSPIGLPLLLGADAPQRLQNAAKGLKMGSMFPALIVGEKPA